MVFKLMPDSEKPDYCRDDNEQTGNSIPWFYDYMTGVGFSVEWSSICQGLVEPVNRFYLVIVIHQTTIFKNHVYKANKSDTF